MFVNQSAGDALELVKSILGPVLLAQVGRQRRTTGDLMGYTIIFLKRLSCAKHARPVLSKLDDGLVLVANGWRIRGTGGFTLGSYVFPHDMPPERLFIIHEYVHVLQWRAEGVKFMWRYIRAGLWNWPPYDEDGWPYETQGRNPYETQALQIEAIYRRTPGLPEPWLLGPCLTYRDMGSN